MPEDVKREYRSTLRAAQAADTRSAIVAAAAHLFVERGYAATTIDAVAADAGVSRKTVFTAVGGKVELLKTAVDWAVAGDDGAVSVRNRPAVLDVLARSGAKDLLAGWTRVLVGIDVRVAGLFRALEVAAESDDDARTLLEESQRQRLSGAREIVKRLIALNALSPDVSRAEAVDIAWLATDPVLYDRFVRVRGWSVTRFEAWLARLLVTQLLG
ncbi:TetR/AcrR family transcriptional regulator [Mycolicibacterium arenosum]|uniref:TetR/AcrR family transcriptional regulator n=1 Tax=Mycolicibacterium arenosum TaxID=2952157 RepID=A0ABT1MBB6_9MYCO|nr:TetR/AcrR family transcriptional regulator [Mycolicibacterium sp. CAU 1645]MCP9275082.1 TetR/AcrR family transcriptional regulator [Mycolicibacterium sp. CAU 1645]